MYGGLSVSCRAPALDHRVGWRLQMVTELQGQGMLGGSSVPWGTWARHCWGWTLYMGETKWAATTTRWPLPAVVYSSSSAPVCLAARRAAGCLHRACPCFFIFSLLPLGRNCSSPFNFNCLCRGKKACLVLLPLSMGYREIDQSFCAYIRNRPDVPKTFLRD